jgi:hypothetical protein
MVCRNSSVLGNSCSVGSWKSAGSPSSERKPAMCFLQAARQSVRCGGNFVCPETHKKEGASGGTPGHIFLRLADDYPRTARTTDFVGGTSVRPLICPLICPLDRFARTGEGDIKKLEGNTGELRLRVGDYRVRFIENPPGTLYIHAVLHRSEAYR